MLFKSAMPLSIDDALGRFGLSQFRPGQREIIEAVIAAERERLRAMMAYAYARGCRRAFLLGYFGDEVHRCGGDALPCDSCEALHADTPISDEDHLLVRKVLSCVARVNGAFARGGGGGGGGGDDDTPVDEPLFARLRELRAKLAREEQLPAYCVFHDRTLVALARARPATLDELAQVPGVGPSKLAKYGAAFLDALRAPDG